MPTGFIGFDRHYRAHRVYRVYTHYRAYMVCEFYRVHSA